MSDMKSCKDKSLKNKIMFSSVSALLILAVVMGTVSVSVVDKLSQLYSQKIMIQLCDNQTLQFDNKLNLVQHSVDIINDYAENLMKINDTMEVYSDEYERHIKDFSIAVANQTIGAVSVYFRYNPEVTGSGTDGFLWTKRTDSEIFQEETITDILEYNSSDIGHVGWFYIPKETGKPLWMTPYYNENLDIFMISYIIPMYHENGEFIGVIGMDIDFSAIINESYDMDIFDSSSVGFVDLKERIVYYSGDDGTVHDRKLSNTFYNHITTINRLNDLLEITDEQGSTSVILCKRLSNGMMLYVNVPKSEIDRDENMLILLCITLTILIYSVSLIIVQKRTSQIVYPIERLTETAKKYAEGDWSAHYISQTDDEIQKLSEGIYQMAKNTQGYINKLNGLARTDAITGVGNKTSYLEMIENIKQNKHEQFDEYAIVAMDLNLLKKTNDTYGHESGDILIKEAARYICNVFSQSPVFRTGGDEFVVILYSSDYQNREKLISEFENGMNYPVPDISEIVLSIAFGMAVSSEGDSDYDSIFKLADERMYQKKKEMKMKRQD